MDDHSEKKKAKGTKKYIIKRRLMFKNYTESFFNHQIILKLQQRFKSDLHEVYIEEINRIALSNNDDKRLQAFNRATVYPHGTNAFKAYKSDMMIVRDLLNKNYADKDKRLRK